MGVIPQGVTHLIESVVSYLYIILLILVIVKIIQLVGSFGGFSKGGDIGKTKKQADDNSSNIDKGGKDNYDSRTSSDTNKKRPHYTYLDPTRLGKVQFKVEDIEGNPVRGAEVIITPNRQKRRFSEPASPAPGGTVEAPPDNEDN